MPVSPTESRRQQPLLLPDATATRALGRWLGETLPAFSVLLLEGDLGAGKTTLTQGIGAGLGIPEAIASPTFTLVNEYHMGRLPLYHMDLYRLAPEQVDTLYPETYWAGEEIEPGLTVIEWSERLPFLPESFYHITLNHTDDDQRYASISGVNVDTELMFPETFR